MLAWSCVGAVEDPPVLWLHGSTGSRRTAPGAEGVRMISYDRPGYGGSTAHPGRSLQSDAQDVRAVLDALAVGRTAVLAFSGGAAVGYACAARLPARVRRLGIVSGAVWPIRPAPSQEVLHGAAARLHADPAAAVGDCPSAPLPMTGASWPIRRCCARFGTAPRTRSERDPRAG